MIIITVIAVILSSIFYRLGGMSKEEARKKLPWVPQWLVKGFTRDFVCVSIVMVWIYLFLPRVDNNLYFYSGALMYASMTTYWDRWPPNKGKDNYGQHGFFIGLALLPIAYGSGLWIEVLIRSLVLAIAMKVWCSIPIEKIFPKIQQVDWDEYGRGVIIALTLAILIPGLISNLF